MTMVRIEVMTLIGFSLGSAMMAGVSYTSKTSTLAILCIV